MCAPPPIPRAPTCTAPQPCTPSLTESSSPLVIPAIQRTQPWSLSRAHHLCIPSKETDHQDAQSDSAQVRESQCELTCPVGGVSPEVPIHSPPRSTPTLAAGAPGVRSVRTQSTQRNPNPTVDALCPSAPPSSSFAQHRATMGKLCGLLPVLWGGQGALQSCTQATGQWPERQGSYMAGLTLWEPAGKPARPHPHVPALDQPGADGKAFQGRWPDTCPLQP